MRRNRRVSSDFGHVTEHDQCIEQPKRRPIVEGGPTRNVGEDQFRLLAGEGLQDAESFGQGVHDVLF